MPRNAPAGANPSQNASSAAGQQKQPGLFAQMASTAAGVAVGSTIGHSLGNLFGGSSAAAAEGQDSALATSQQNSWNENGAGKCDADARSFTKCMDEHEGNMQICGWYLEQLVSLPR
jgi:hypothetical protein